jgi:hypothetical protein
LVRYLFVRELQLEQIVDRIKARVPGSSIMILTPSDNRLRDPAQLSFGMKDYAWGCSVP